MLVEVLEHIHVAVQRCVVHCSKCAAFLTALEELLHDVEVAMFRRSVSIATVLQRSDRFRCSH